MHFTATFLKRLRIIKRDFKGFMFELLLPIIIMIFGLLIVRISFIVNLPEQSINLNTYLPTSSPVIIPIGSDSSAYLTSMASEMRTRGGSNMDISEYTTGSTPVDFDKNHLFSLKKSSKLSLGGIFYESTPTTVAGKTIYTFNSVVNSRVPTSFFYLQTLAAQSIINKDLSPTSPVSI